MTNEISREDIVKLLSYDAETGVFTWNVSRGTKKAGSIAGKTNNKGYRVISINRHHYGAHRLAYLITYGLWPTYEIDHKNGIKTDNRISNLRDVTRAINKQNTKKSYANNGSGLLGVSFSKRTGRWYSRICVDGKNKSLGFYDSPDKAHAAYMKAKGFMHREAVQDA